MRCGAIAKAASRSANSSALIASPRLRYHAVQASSKRMHASSVDLIAPGGTPVEYVDDNVQ